MLLFVALVGGGIVAGTLRSRDSVDWLGGPAPAYVRLLMVVGICTALVFAYRILGRLRPVAVGGGYVYVSRWIGEEAFPLSEVTALYIDRNSSIGGQSPIRIEFGQAGRRTRYAFLLAERLDIEDVEELTGLAVGDVSEDGENDA